MAVRWVWRFIRFLSGNCEVCGGRGEAKLFKVVRTGAVAAPTTHAIPLSVVIPCPHCNSPYELLMRLPVRGSKSIPDGVA